MIGIAAAAAGTPLSQAKGTDLERTGQDVGAAQTAAQGQLKAESAAGVGQPDGQDHQSDDRDADGRLPWRIRRTKKEAPADEDAPPAPSPPKDPAGAAGNLLDLSG
jgi:hypothetical protein